MATTLPDDTTKADFDAGSDDPKQARVEFATNADIQNELKDALGDFAQFSNQADSGLETVGQSGGTPDDIQVKLDGTSIKRGTNGVAIDAPHERKTVDYLAVAADRGKLIEMDKATAITLDLTAAATLTEGWFIYVKNSGAGTLTIDPDSSETIDDVTTITLGQNQSTMIFCDGISFWTVGLSTGGLPRSYLAGLTLSNDADATNDINMTAGAARASDNNNNLILTSEQTKQIDVSWATGNDAGGLSSSLTLTDDTWYHVHLILVSGIVEVGFDTSLVAANLVTDHSATAYRRIGSVRRGTATNLPFNQYGDYFSWDDPPLSWDVTDQSTTQIGRELLTPPGIRLDAIINALVSHATTGIQVYLRDPSANDEAPSNTAAPLATIVAEVGGALHNQGPMRVRTNASSEINSRSTASSTTLKIVTLGWIDHRGRDD